jgi:hypothetical protein
MDSRSPSDISHGSSAYLLRSELFLTGLTGGLTSSRPVLEVDSDWTLEVIMEQFEVVFSSSFAAEFSSNFDAD